MTDAEAAELEFDWGGDGSDPTRRFVPMSRRRWFRPTARIRRRWISC